MSPLHHPRRFDLLTVSLSFCVHQAQFFLSLLLSHEILYCYMKSPHQLQDDVK